MPLSLDEARAELAAKTIRQIQEETAISWARRAVAAYENAGRAINPATKLRWILDAHAYSDEALEHASLAHDQALPIIKEILRPWQAAFRI
jgi:hypothetical protein